MELGTLIPNFVFGILAIVGGVLIIRYRRRLNEWVFKSQDSLLGRRAANASAGRQKPFVLGVVGFCCTVMGIVMVTTATIYVLRG